MSKKFAHNISKFKYIFTKDIIKCLAKLQVRIQQEQYQYNHKNMYQILINLQLWITIVTK